MNTDEKLDVTLEWADDIPFKLKVCVEPVWANNNLIVAKQKDYCVTETVVTLPKVQAIKFARIVVAGLQAEKFIEIGRRLKEQTEKLLEQQENFHQEVIRFGTERMLADAKNYAHKPANCPRCDICEREDCDGCDVAESCLDGSCTNCPEKDGCYAIASNDPFVPEEDDDDEDWEDDDDDESWRGCDVHYPEEDADVDADVDADADADADADVDADADADVDADVDADADADERNRKAV